MLKFGIIKKSTIYIFSKKTFLLFLLCFLALEIGK